MSDTKHRCNCFEERLALIEEKVLEQLGEDAADINVEWQNLNLFFGGGDHSPVNPKIEITYMPRKKNGELSKNVKRDKVTILADYCIFCGREYQKENDHE